MASCRYEAKLLNVDEAIQHIMGENGILKSGTITFQKEVGLSNTELNELLSQKRELYEIVNSCQSDIQYVTSSISLHVLCILLQVPTDIVIISYLMYWHLTIIKI